MSIRASGLLLSIVALAGFAASAFADDMAKPHKPKARVIHATKAPAYGDVVLPVGSVKDPGSDNRYFSDTITPRYTLGPTIFNRWQ